MTRDQQFLYVVTALIAASPQLAQAATVTRTTTAPISFTAIPATFSFADIANADQLVSISGGSVYAPEGATFQIRVDYSNTASPLIFSQNLGSGVTYNLTSVPAESFTAGTINGLTFVAPGDSGVPGFGTIPTGTIFTFHTLDVVTAVPEPATWAAMVAGFGMLGCALRARRRKTAFATG